MAQQENRRLNLELQEAKGRQEEQSAQAQQRVVSEAPGQQEVANVPGQVVNKLGERHGSRLKNRVLRS